MDQSYKKWELIVVDDGSIDTTSEIVNGYRKKDDRIIIIELARNGGLSNARNEGCKAAKGGFIAFLDSDDLWNEKKLETQINFHLVNPDIEISHTDFHLFNNRGFLKRPFKYFINLNKHKQGQLYPGICYKNPIGILTVMVKTTLLNEVGYFDTSLWTFEDQDLWVRIAKRAKPFGYIPTVLAYYRLVPGSITGKTVKYKHAYRKFMTKLLNSESLNPDLLLRYYYRYFGTVYFKNNQFRLSRLYFYKSIQLVPFDFVSLSTFVYLIYVIAKQSIQNLKSNVRSFS